MRLPEAESKGHAGTQRLAETAHFEMSCLVRNSGGKATDRQYLLRKFHARICEGAEPLFFRSGAESAEQRKSVSGLYSTSPSKAAYRKQGILCHTSSAMQSL